MVGRSGCVRTAHGAVRLEVISGVVVRIEVCKVDVPAGVLDLICGGSIGPLRHARCTEQVVAARPYGREE